MSLDSTTISAPASGNSGQIAISTTRDCTWSASSTVPWVTLTSASSRQGSASFAYRVEANPQPSSRRGTVDVNATAVTIIQDAASCTFAVSPSNPSLGAAGGNVAVTVTTLSGCAWTAATGEPWVHVTAGASGTGNGTVQIAVDANSGAARTSHVRVGDLDVTITESAGTMPTPAPTPMPAPEPSPSPTPTPPLPPPCHYTLSATNQSVPPAGGSNAVRVETDTGCAWTAKANVAWLTILNGASGMRSDVVSYAASPNPGAARSGTLTIANEVVTVTQAALPACVYALYPSSAEMGETGGAGSAILTTSSDCAWTAVSNVSWITLTSGTSGTGNGTVAFTVAPNTGAARVGSFTAAAQVFIVSQAATVSSVSALTQQRATSP